MAFKKKENKSNTKKPKSTPTTPPLIVTNPSTPKRAPSPTIRVLTSIQQIQSNIKAPFKTIRTPNALDSLTRHPSSGEQDEHMKPPPKELEVDEHTRNESHGNFVLKEKIQHKEKIHTDSEPSLSRRQPIVIDENEDEYIEVGQKNKKIMRKPCKWLNNQLSPSRTPPNDELKPTAVQSFNSYNPINNLIENLGINLQEKASKPILITKSPRKQGTLGEIVEVITNHFKCTKLPNENILVYSFEFEPNIKNKSLRWAAKREWESKYCETHLGGKLIAYNGLNKAYVYQSLPFTARQFTFELSDKNEKLKTYKIKMMLYNTLTNEKSNKISTLEPSSLTDYARNQSNDYPIELIQALNCTLKQKVPHGWIERDKHIFSSQNNRVEINVQGFPSVSCLHGYFRSLRPTQQGLALTVDTSHKMFHKKSNVLDFVKNILEYKGDVNYMKKILEENIIKVSGALRGLMVESNHYSDNVTRHHKVVGITEQGSFSLKFQTRDGRNMSIKEYFEKMYNMKFKLLDLPCLILSSTIINYMPMELCFITENQMLNDQQQLHLNVTKNMHPSTRIQSITNFMKEILSQSNNHSKSFNLEFDVQPTKTIARILPSPSGLINHNTQPDDHLYHWGVLNLAKRTNENEVINFMHELIGDLRRRGLVVNNYQYTNGALLNTYPLEFMEAFHKKICDAMPKNGKTRVNLIFVVVDGKRRCPYYNEIKYWGDCIKGVPTQVIASDIIFKPNKWRPYLKHLSLKINCRLGGSNLQFRSWNKVAIRDKVLTNIKWGKFLAFGADVTHPDTGTNNPSLAAVTGSLDFGCSYFGAKIFQQPSNQEFFSNLEWAVTELLQDFKTWNNNKKLPEHMFFYRDGVGEFQFKNVIESELPQIQRGARAAEPGYKPLISLVVVQKRHHTRFFLPEVAKWTHQYAATMDVRRSNIKAGTVVDHDVCDSRGLNFYLSSHHPELGTVRPTHYHVLYDDANLSVDDFQNITNYLCHIYQRKSQPVSMPAPAYYAHLSAYRGRQVYAAPKHH